MSVKKQSIENTSHNARGARDSYNRCYEVNKQICDALIDFCGIEAELVEGEFKQIEYDGLQKADGHYFVFVDSSDITDHEHSMIVDGAVEQFNNRNVEDKNRDVKVAIAESADEIPNVKFTFEYEEFYKHYGL